MNKDRAQKFRDLETALGHVDRAEELIQRTYTSAAGDLWLQSYLEEMVEHVRGMKRNLASAIHYMNMFEDA